MNCIPTTMGNELQRDTAQRNYGRVLEYSFKKDLAVDIERTNLSAAHTKYKATKSMSSG